MTYPPLPPSSPPPYGQQPYSGQPYSGPPVSPAGPQQIHHQISMQQPVTDKSKRFLNMSGGVLITLIVVLILVCCIGPIVACFGFGGLGMIGAAGTPDATAEVISCKVDDTNEFLKSTDVTIKVTNPASTEQFVTVEIELRNAAGTKVGETFAFLTVSANSSAEETTKLLQDSAGGTTCVITDVS